jgi:hypothetical protein
LCLFNSCTASWTVPFPCRVMTFLIMSLSMFSVGHLLS